MLVCVNREREKTYSPALLYTLFYFVSFKTALESTLTKYGHSVRGCVLLPLHHSVSVCVCAAAVEQVEKEKREKKYAICFFSTNSMYEEDARQRPRAIAHRH